MSEVTSEPTETSKAKTTRCPKPQRLKIQGDSTDAVRNSFTEKMPKQSSK